MLIYKKRLTFISDTPPLKSKGSGISVLLFNILIALEGSYDLSVITFCRETSATPKEIIQDNSNKEIFICDRRSIKLYHAVRFGLFKKIIQLVSFLISLPSIIKRYNNRENIFVTVIGASARPVYKAWVIMKLAPKSKHCLYIVDDLELINKGYKNKFELFMIAVFLRRTIKRSDVLITISEGLKDLYLKLLNKESFVMLPHYKKVQPIIPLAGKQPTEFIFLFTGGLNVLYNDSLKFFASVIEVLNKQSNNLIKLKLIIQTYSSYTDFKKLGLDMSSVSYSTTDDRIELLKIYQRSDCFLVPYSFSEDNRGLVVTSFPQKIAEIIQYGKPILAFGPSYSSMVQFFSSLKLAYICDQFDAEKLKKSISAIVNEHYKFDHGNYIKAYDMHFSADAVNIVFENINNLFANES